MGVDLLLDDQLRNWVLIPVVVATFLYVILINNISRLTVSTPKSQINQMQQQQTLLRSRRLRQNGKYLSSASFHTRRGYFSDDAKGILVPPEGLVGNPMGAMNPAMMMDGMKGQIFTVVPYLAFAGVMRYMFAGFVLVRVPFPLTMGFKSMLQSEVALPTLDMSYVSSMSWYLLCLFGLRGVTNLLLSGARGKGAAINRAVMRSQQMNMMMGPMAPMQQVTQPEQLYVKERENLVIVRHEFALANVENRVVQQYREKPGMSRK